MWGCECRNEPQGFAWVLGPSPASLIPARRIKETGDGVATRCLYMVLSASSTLWCRESRPAPGPIDHIWPRVVSPAAILPASTACCQGTVALLPLLVHPDSLQSLRLLLLPLICHQRRTFFNLICLYALSGLLSPPLLPVTLLSFLPKPSSSAHPLSLCFPFLSSFLCTFPCSYFLCFPFSPLSSCSRMLAHLRLVQCAGSTGHYAGTSLLIICAAWRMRWQMH